MITYCLVDFFNLGLWPTGREPNKGDVRDGLDELVLATMRAAPSGGEMTLRLYGGWNRDVAEERVPLRELTEVVLRSFPRRLGSTRLRFQLAEAPIWDPSLKLLGSVRKVHYPQFAASFDIPGACPHAGNCTLPSLRSWAAGRCPDGHCGARLAQVASGYRQKMVDTLLTADALAIVHGELADVVIIASDDVDMLPAVLALKSYGLQTVCLRRRSLMFPYYEGILARDRVTICHW